MDGNGAESSPSRHRTRASLKPKSERSVEFDESRGAWKCRRCGWCYPNDQHSSRHRREHRKHCVEIQNVHLWLGEDALDSPDSEAASPGGEEELFDHLAGVKETPTSMVDLDCSVGNQLVKRSLVWDGPSNVSPAMDDQLGIPMHSGTYEHQEKEEIGPRSPNQEGERGEADIPSLIESLMNETGNGEYGGPLACKDQAETQSDVDFGRERQSYEGKYHDDLPESKGHEAVPKREKETHEDGGDEECGMATYETSGTPEETIDADRCAGDGHEAGGTPQIEKETHEDGGDEECGMTYETTGIPEETRDEERCAGDGHGNRFEENNDGVQIAEQETEGEIHRGNNLSTGQEEGTGTVLLGNEAHERSGMYIEKYKVVRAIGDDRGDHDDKVEGEMQEKNTSMEFTKGKKQEVEVLTEEKKHTQNLPGKEVDNFPEDTMVRENQTEEWENGEKIGMDERSEDGRKKEVKTDVRVLKHDTQTGSSSVYTISSTVETYTGSVVLRKQDGFVPHTVGSSMQQTPFLRKKIEYAGGLPKVQLEIVQDFSRAQGGENEFQAWDTRGSQTEANEASTSTLTEFPGESEVDRVLRLQTTHDLLCPVCGSCITKRVILRKRKRTTVLPEEELEEAGTPEIPEELDQPPVEEWGCLACLILFFRRVRGVWHTPSTVEFEEPSYSIPRPLEEVQTAETPGTPSLQESPDAKADYNCLPVLFPRFPWGQAEPMKAESGDPVRVVEFEGPSPWILRPLEEVQAAETLGTPSLQESPDAKAARTPVVDPVRAVEFEGPSAWSPRPLEEAQAAETPGTPSLQESPDAKADYNCLPVLFPRFPWGQAEPMKAESGDPVRVVEFEGPSPWILRPLEEVQAAETLGTPSLQESPDAKAERTPSVDPVRAVEFEGPSAWSPRPLEEVQAAETPGTPSLQESPDAKADYNCLPVLFPRFPWGQAEPMKAESGDPVRVVEFEGPSPWILRPLEEVQAAETLGTPSLQESPDAKAERTPSVDPVRAVEFEGPSAWSPRPLEEVQAAETPGTPSLQESPDAKADYSCLPVLFPRFPWGQAEPTKDLTTLPSESEVPFAEEVLQAEVIELSGSEVAVLDADGLHKQKAGMDCLPMLLPAYPWEPAETRQDIDVQRPVGVVPAPETAVEPHLQDDEVVPDADVQTQKAGLNCLPLLLPAYPWEPATVRHPVNVVSGQETEGEPHLPDDMVVVPDADDHMQKAGEVTEEVKPIDIPLPPDVIPAQGTVGEPLLLTIPEDDVVVPDADHTQEAGLNCLPLLLPAYPWEQAGRTVQQGPNTEMKSARETDYNCLPLLLSWRQSPVTEDAEPVKGKPTDTDMESVPSEPPLPKRSQETYEVVTQETQVDVLASITTTTNTATYITSSDPTAKGHREIDSIKVDTSVTSIGASVKQDQGDVQVSILLDGPTIVLDGKRHNEGASSSQMHDTNFTSGLSSSSQLSTGNSAMDLPRKEEMSLTISSGYALLDVDSPPATVTDELQQQECRCLPVTLQYPNWSWTSWKSATEDNHLKEPLLQTEVPQTSVTVTRLPVSEMPQTDGSPPFADELVRDETCSCLLTGYKYFWRPEHAEGDVPPSIPTYVSVEDLPPPLLRPKEEDPPSEYESDAIRVDIPDSTSTSATLTTVDTRIEAVGTDPVVVLDTVAEVAEERGIIPPTLLKSDMQEYLTCIVYGGLDVSLTSLGVVASAAGGEAKTRTVLAMGLANLIFGAITFFHKVVDLYNGNPTQFRMEVGRSLRLHGILAIFSFVICGSLPPLVFGFSFLHTGNRDYKMLVTFMSSLVVLVLLGCGKVYARCTEQSYRMTLSTLILTGFFAVAAGFYTGEYFSKLLDNIGFDDN